MREGGGKGAHRGLALGLARNAKQPIASLEKPLSAAAAPSSSPRKYLA